MTMNELTESVIGAAIEVHRRLGPGVREFSYQTCLSHELQLRSIPHRVEVPLPVDYKGVRLDCGYRLDLLVDDRVVVELKTVAALLRIHEAQLLTQLRLGGWRLGLLLNFREVFLKDGIKRRVYDCERVRKTVESQQVEHSSQDLGGDPSLNAASHELLAAAIEVHRTLGPGLLASTYQECLCHELCCRNMPFERGRPIDVDYKGLIVKEAGILELLVDNSVVVKVMAVDAITPLDVATLQGNLRVSAKGLGLLLNFNLSTLAEGIHRCISSAQ